MACRRPASQQPGDDAAAAVAAAAVAHDGCQGHACDAKLGDACRPHTGPHDQVHQLAGGCAGAYLVQKCTIGISTASKDSCVPSSLVLGKVQPSPLPLLATHPLM